MKPCCRDRDCPSSMVTFSAACPFRALTWAKLAILLVLVSAQALATPSSEPTAKSAQRTLSVCTLARDSKAYEGKILRVHGTTVTTFEEVVLMDPACATLT